MVFTRIIVKKIISIFITHIKCYILLHVVVVFVGTETMDSP